MHPEAFDFVSDMVREHGPFTDVVEIGGRDVNGNVRALFGDAAYVTTDVAPGPGVDVVVNGKDFAPDTAPDCVVCTEVLEHTADARAIVENMARMLRPGGVGIITCAGFSRHPHSAIDGNGLQPGEFYENVDGVDIVGWVDEFASFVLNSPQGRDTRVMFVKGDV
jgi:SAM-dependent methyltransferase